MLSRIVNAPAAPQWSVRRMRLLVVACAVGLTLTALGAVLAVTAGTGAGLGRRAATRGGLSVGTSTVAAAATHAGPGTSAQAVARAEQDALAARPMPAAPLAAARPAPISTRDPGPPLVLPPPTRIGSGGVPTGYPHTPAGALAQLAAIDQAALQSGTVQGARAVGADWISRGGASADAWFGSRSMAAFLTAAGLSGGGSPQLRLLVTPLMGQIKGTAGQDFVVPCVDFEVEATLATTARVAVADCQRMTWVGDEPGGRWQIAAGEEPARPPSVWPDTDAAIAAGYVDVIERQGRHA